MRNIGPLDAVLSCLYQYTYGNWYFKKKFYFDQFLNLVQRELSVDEYTCRFRELQHQCASNGSESHDVTRFMRGLNPDIEEKMKWYQTVHEAFKEAIHVEHVLQQSPYNSVNLKQEGPRKEEEF